MRLVIICFLLFAVSSLFAITPDDFSSWTREDWKAMYDYQKLAFQPTEQEIASQNETVTANRISAIHSVLQAWGVDEVPLPSTLSGWNSLLTNFAVTRNLGLYVGNPADYRDRVISECQAQGGNKDAFLKVISRELRIYQ